jgi:hypothetical protein
MGAADKTKHVTFAIENWTGIGKFLLTDDSVYAYLIVGEVAWQFTGSGSSYTVSETGSAYSITLAPESTTTVALDAALSVVSAQLWFSTSDTIVSSDGTVTKPTAGTAEYYYDFVEFTCRPSASGTSGLVNIDTTQVDQFGFPIKLQVVPADPNYPEGSGFVSQISRSEIFDAYVPYLQSNKLAGQGFEDCVVASATQGDPAYCLLNPTHVCANQLVAIQCNGTLAPATPSKFGWSANFTYTQGTGAPSNSWIGRWVVGPYVPVGATLTNTDGATMTISSPNAFETPPKTKIDVFVVTPVASKLGTYFDAALEALFARDSPSIQIEQNIADGDAVFSSSVTQATSVQAIDGKCYTYTVLQFGTYNIYYPFFATNSPAGKLDPYGNPVPPPPMYFASLNICESPSQMAFSADGVFADSSYQTLLNGQTPAVLGGIENVVVTALARGSLPTWQQLKGTIKPDADDNKNATVTIENSEPSTSLVGTYMFSFRLGTVPMTVTWVDPANKTLKVRSPVEIKPTVTDLLTFSTFYPPGGTWSAFAGFLHNGTVGGQNFAIGGRAYALPYDDQGGFSSDLNSKWKTTPTTVTITLNPWLKAL